MTPTISIEVGEGLPVGGCDVLGGGGLIDIDDPAPKSSLAVCAGSIDEIGPCAQSNGTCVLLPAEPLFAKVCVWKDGDVACPPDFPSKNLVYQGWDDTRDCGGCDCGLDPLVSTCFPLVGLYGDTFCGDGGATDVIPGECAVVSSNNQSYSYELLGFDAQGECSGVNTPPIGGVFPVETQTVCCSSGAG